MSFEASPEARNIPALGSFKAELITDAPEFLSLVDLCPSILIYTRSTFNFERVWLGPNCRYSAYPKAIICPRSDTEVVHTLRLASGLTAGSASHGHCLPITIRGGGHDSFGRSTLAGGIVLDTRHLDHITLAEDKQAATVGPGVLAGVLMKFLAPHGVFAPMGYCSTVGYTGWCLGGGFGVFTASYGAGAEGIIGARLITADGRVIESGDDPELFWALCGTGNGNFGVVVQLRVKIYAEPKVLGGYVGFPIREAESVLGRFGERYEQDIPDEFNGDVISAPVTGIGPVVSFMFVWTARENQDLRAGWAYLAEIRVLGSLAIDTVKETTPSGFLTTLDDTFKDFVGAPFYVLSPTIDRYTHDFGRIIASRSVPLSGHAVGGTHYVHGKVTEPNPAVALPNRRHITITLFASAEKHHDNDGPEITSVREWVDGFVADVDAAGLGLPPSYASFSKSDINLSEFYGAENARRLRALKSRYDPKNLFRMAYPTITQTKAI
ncbi:FAD-binding domain-containing protein [Xylariaceae sp. FL0662B]|nr:FAD-binding domain-containing protein [Xylariaceae sp. FL0662B]